MNTKKYDNLKDPLEMLPEELVSHSLSFLPPRSIPSTAALSRSWRLVVNSNPSLHREVDLSHMNQADDLLSVVYAFNHLSSLALGNLVRISLNLTCFFGFEASQNSRLTTFDILSLSKASHSLKELSLAIDSNLVPSTSPNRTHGSFLLPLIRQLQSFSSISSIYVAADLGMHLKILSSSPSSKDFVLYSNAGEGDGRYANVEEIKGFIVEAQKVIRGSLIELSIDDRSYWEPEDKLEILQALLDHKSTLQHLDLGEVYFRIDGNDVWDLVFQFSSLTSLCLNFQDGEEETILKVPTEVKTCVNLKELVLEVQGCYLDWTSFSKWCGWSLQEFKVNWYEEIDAETALFAPGSSILGSQGTLNVLRLQFVDCEHSQKQKPEIGFSFPALELLSLREVRGSTLKTLWNLNTPRIKSLSIIITSANHSLATLSIDWLIEFLTDHAFTLIELTVIVSSFLDFVDIQFNFKALERLRLGAGSKIDRWLSSSKYPSLVSLSKANKPCKEIKQLFKPNAPKLQILEEEVGE